MPRKKTNTLKIFVDITNSLAARKKRIKRLLFTGGFLLFIYVLGFGDYGFYQYYQLVQQEKEMNAELKLLQDEAVELKEKKQLLSSEDPDYMQRIAREKYGLVKPGEKIYKLTPDTEKDQ